MTSQEREWLRRLLRHDPAAFRQLHETYLDRVYRFCYRLCGNQSDAEDLTQEVFVAAFEGLERFEGRSALSTWLYRIAVFRWRKLRDRPGFRAESADADYLPECGASPEDVGVARLSLEDALAELSAPQREVFLLVKAEGLTYREAAAVLDVPQGTVQWRVHEAVCRLRELLREDRVRVLPEPGMEAEPCVATE